MHWRDVHSSGSTGRPVRLKRSDVVLLLVGALTLRYHFWHRRDLSAKNVTIRRFDGEQSAAGSRWAPCFPTGPSLYWDQALPVGVLLGRLFAEEPEYLLTRPSIVRAMIRRSREIGGRPRRLREVRTYGEVVDADLRRLCEEEWGVPLSDDYCCEEFGPIALQCPEHDHYHIQAETTLVEVLDDDGSLASPARSAAWSALRSTTWSRR